MRFAVSAQHCETAEFIARPLADCGRGDVADVVIVEAQHGAERRIADRLPSPPQAIAMQSSKIDALLEIDIHDPMSVEARPVVMRVDILGFDLEAFRNRGLGRLLARSVAVFLLLVDHVLLRYRL